MHCNLLAGPCICLMSGLAGDTELEVLNLSRVHFAHPELQGLQG